LHARPCPTGPRGLWRLVAMAPLVAGAAGADAEWWERRLSALRDRATALATEARKQDTELLRLRQAACDSHDCGQGLERQARADMHEERAAQQALELELSAMAQACQKTAELDTEKRRLLDAISEANWRLGRQALVASKCADAEEEASEANRTAVGRSNALRKDLRSLGDAQADLAGEEEAERAKRHQLREAVRVRLHRHASERAELERRLAGRNAEIEKWQDRLDASAAAETQAIEEAQRLQEQAQRCESYVGPQKDREREELRRQLRETAVVDDHLRDELREAKERLWRKEQREREMGGRPWAAFVEAE